MSRRLFLLKSTPLDLIPKQHRLPKPAATHVANGATDGAAKGAANGSAMVGGGDGGAQAVALLEEEVCWPRGTFG